MGVRDEAKSLFGITRNTQHTPASDYTVTLAVEGPDGSSIEAKTGYALVGEATGSLMVTISPPPAVDAGAQWQVLPPDKNGPTSRR